jgi:hypothetical protein
MSCNLLPLNGVIGGIFAIACGPVFAKLEA